MSDWGAVNDVQRAMDAGMDLEMPGISNGHREVLAAGRIPALDRGAEKVLQDVYKRQGYIRMRWQRKNRAGPWCRRRCR